MIALCPRDIAKAVALTAALGTFLHLMDRIVAGFVFCQEMGALLPGCPT